jgi:uncharacterized membrane protein
MRSAIIAVLVCASSSAVLLGQAFVPLPEGAGTVSVSADCGKVLVDDRGPDSSSHSTVYRVWDRATGTMVTIPGEPPGPGLGQVECFAISHNGQVVGGRAFASAGARPVRYVIGGGAWQDVGLPVGAAYAEPWALNGDGTMMGGEEGANESGASFLWTASGGSTVFADPFAQDQARIRGLSSDGSARIGWSYDGFGFGLLSWYWTASGGFVQIAPVAGERVNAMMVSRNGQWVACNTMTVSFPQSPLGGFLWSPVSGRENIEPPPGVTAVQPQAVNEDGTVVVGYAVMGSASGGQAFVPWVWRRGHGHFFPGEWLAATLAPGVADRWDLESIVSVSMDGTTVVGDGGYYASLIRPARSRGWLLTLPAPCAADVGRVGGLAGSDGLLNNNDLIVFIDLFFASSPRADIGMPAGTPGSDGVWDNNDFIVFIDRFFAGC